MGVYPSSHLHSVKLKVKHREQLQWNRLYTYVDNLKKCDTNNMYDGNRWNLIMSGDKFTLGGGGSQVGCYWNSKYH